MIFMDNPFFKERWKIPICTLLLNYNYRLFWWFYQIGYAQIVELLKTRQIFDHAKKIKINMSKTSISSMNSHNICLPAYLKLVQLAIHLCVSCQKVQWPMNGEDETTKYGFYLSNGRHTFFFFFWMIGGTLSKRRSIFLSFIIEQSNNQVWTRKIIYHYLSDEGAYAKGSTLKSS